VSSGARAGGATLGARPPELASRPAREGRLRDRGGARWCIAACAAVAVALDALQLSRPGYLLGGTPDIGVWFGSAVRLVHGALPYRDFVLVQPPGVVLLLSPAALLSELVGTRYGLAAVRIAAVLVAAANVVLVGRVVRHRGPLATLVAGGTVAVWPAILYALNAGLLEPLMDLLCLAGAGLALREGCAAPSARRWCLSGAAFGMATMVELPAVLPALILAAVVARRSRRHLLAFAAGGVGLCVVVSAPFFAVAPGPFVGEALLSQLFRVSAGGRVPLGPRIAEMTLLGTGPAAVLAVAAGAALIVVGSAALRRRAGDLERFALLSFAGVGLLQLVPPQYYPQYPAFWAPFAALSLALAVDALAAGRAVRTLAAAATAAVLSGALGGLVAGVERSAANDAAPAVDAVIPAGGCTLSSGASLIVPSDRLVAARPGCTAMVDAFGTALSSARDPAQERALFQDALEHTDYLVLSGPVGGSLVAPTPALAAYVTGHFHPVLSGRLWIYVRDGWPVG
jgi:alpha-1,2-mannosyltransferase